MHKIQAEFAPNRPEGMCARGPSMRSANTVSMIAWHPGALDDPLELAHPGCAGAVPELGGGCVFATCRLRRR